MDISEILRELNLRFGLGAALEIREDPDEPYTAYIENPHYLQSGRTAKEAFLKSAELWLARNDQDQTPVNAGMELLVERVRGEGSQHTKAIRQEGADSRDLRS